MKLSDCNFIIRCEDVAEKWKEGVQDEVRASASQNSVQGNEKFLAPPPTKNSSSEFRTRTFVV
jgi:hypothetical protein